ncbi:[Fructose-bisphosphate aldolase]-lysine N-methyltransferase [Actinidia chinensis var. chinensis]|uniref:[Fructose-bisphosphate aldolase]-lysine N-methyltransferase n=1 Tax=Actinidia chinensis var. chinensis TaxID=1590841 RepID=A0A2R6RCS8_ACTCC|nr:[Fructose-bisphosphate aldolase]-lysine N-methyltransferase [Actinidia chinensis var. chinensis]
MPLPNPNKSGHAKPRRIRARPIPPMVTGILLAVPLDMAITPMRVLQDPILSLECSAMFEEGEVDDRFSMILFLTNERLRKNSSWKPKLCLGNLDMLPTTFGNPLWFADDELLELKGTTVYCATELQKKKLHSLYDGRVKNLTYRDKVKNLVNKLLVLSGEIERMVDLEEGSGTEDNDAELLQKALSSDIPEGHGRY